METKEEREARYKELRKQLVSFEELFDKTVKELEEVLSK